MTKIDRNDPKAIAARRAEAEKINARLRQIAELFDAVEDHMKRMVGTDDGNKSTT